MSNAPRASLPLPTASPPLPPAASGGRRPSGTVVPASATSAAAAPPPAAPHPDAAVRSPAAAALVDVVRDRAFAGSPEYDCYGPGACGPLPSAGAAADRPPCDLLFAAAGEPADPDAAFAALRWGGRFVYASRDRAAVAALPAEFVRRGFEIDRPPAAVRKPVFGLTLPFVSPRVHYFAARKVALTLPREISERFTYHVYLSFDRALGRHVVVKEIPSVERVSARLRHRFPDAAADLIERRARKFTDKVFPLFLTREAAMLKLLARDLPERYRGRVPALVDMEQDGRGFVRRLRMGWMRAARPGGRPLSQLDFALQAADLLRAMHDDAGIIHLDLRLDNMVITADGVGFVDFGSAVRVGENIEGNPLLNTIFDELMRTSQIQRMLEKMMAGGMVTNRILNEAHGKVDKGVDLFYLALQMNKPLSNPDFRGLVRADPASPEAVALSALTDEVLKPRDPARPTYRTAADLLAGVRAVAGRLGHAAA